MRWAGARGDHGKLAVLQAACLLAPATDAPAHKPPGGPACRGWAWTRALMGVPANEVHLCGDGSGEPSGQPEHLGLPAPGGAWQAWRGRARPSMPADVMRSRREH